LHIHDLLVYEIDVSWPPTHLSILNFCSSSRKAKPKAMQETWDKHKCIPLLKFTKWTSAVIPCVPYLTSSMPLLHSLLLKGTRREFDNEYMRFLNLRHSCTLLVRVSSSWWNNYSFSSNHLKANMWSSGIGKKITTYAMYIVKLRNTSKRVTNFFKSI
jgi:hypothetical protein